MSTLSTLKTSIRADLSMKDTVFITDTMLNDYINKGIEKASKIILGLYENYFETMINIPLISGIDIYKLPIDIFANKITKFIYNGTSEKYEIKPIVNQLERTEIQSTDLYRYNIINTANVVVSDYNSGTYVCTFSSPHMRKIGDSVYFYQSDTSTARGSTTTVASVTDDYVITLSADVSGLVAGDVLRIKDNIVKIYPKAKETSTSNVEMWYIRDARQLVNDTDECDIPEYESFVILYAKFKCLCKDVMNPLFQIIKAELDEEKQDMIDTLSKRRDDGNTELVQDFSFYRDFDSI